MKAQKVTVVITVRTLHIDSVPGLLRDAIEQIEAEMEDGHLAASDGDVITWETNREPAHF